MIKILAGQINTPALMHVKSKIIMSHCDTKTVFAIITINCNVKLLSRYGHIKLLDTFSGKQGARFCKPVLIELLFKADHSTIGIPGQCNHI
jgi:hypothetical protein